jgi:rubrerythrin
MLQEITLKKCIERAVATEEVGARFYQRMAKKFADNAEVAALFELLAKDEEIHRQQFSKLLTDLPDDEGVSVTPEREQYLRAMSVSAYFSRREGPFHDIDSIEERDDALEQAFNFEKATLGFYQAVKEVLAGDNDALIKVIEAERRHVARIMEVMITGAKFRGLSDDWS